jgi:hypothetical protein
MAMMVAAVSSRYKPRRAAAIPGVATHVTAPSAMSHHRACHSSCCCRQTTAMLSSLMA